MTDVLTSEIVERLQYPKYWEKPSTSWGSVADWDLYLINEEPGVSRYEAHGILAMELKTLLKYLANGSRAWNKAIALQRQLKVSFKFSLPLPKTSRHWQFVLTPPISVGYGLLLDFNVVARLQSHSDVARYVMSGALKPYPAPIRRLTGIRHSSAGLKWEAFYGLDLRLLSPEPFKRQNKKNVVTSSIWVEHHQSLLKTSAESKINEIVNKRKIENIARTATSAAAEVSYAQNEHEISKRPRVDVNADDDNDDEDKVGVRPSDPFGAKYDDEDSDEISERIRPFDATTSATGEKYGYISPSIVLRYVRQALVSDIVHNVLQPAARTHIFQSVGRCRRCTLQFIPINKVFHYAGESLTSVCQNFGPCSSLPRAKQFLSDADVQKLRQKVANVIKTESQLNSSVKAFLEALMLSNIVSLQKISKSKRAYGTAGVYALLCQRLQEDPHQLMQKEIISTEAINRNVADVRKLCAQLEHVFQRSEDDVDHQLTLTTLKQIDIHDADTQYVAECLDVANAWVRDYHGTSQSERTVDVHLVAPLARAPNSIFLYGENQSNADKEEKSVRSETPRSGKACDFLFLNRKHEAGVGENSGPNCKDNHQKGITDFVDVIKVARSQHMALKSKCVEECGSDPPPYIIQQALKSVSIPFFQVIGLKIRFYIPFQIDGDLFGLFEWATQNIPTTDSDVTDVIFLSKRFLVHRNLLDRAGRLGESAVRKAKFAGESNEFEPGEKTVELEKILTPKTKRTNVERPPPKSPPKSPTRGTRKTDVVDLVNLLP
ncbi:hypothetical protein BC936DRAFT_140671 [Jimgerdemannia flammicorona]|uniref:Uncharacterized protein n=1 Tax=Jimgerdemannia flammicorona TaxID=994334 RepID=A0A433AFY6_9FUNG|nr:hypothetical protein BC936DRAFT_140671 [Jimgerdemannia flammicorona]